VGLAAHFFFAENKMTKGVDIEQLRGIASPVVAGLGYELVDLEWKHEGRWVLRLFLDRDGGISHDDCARASRALSAELDVADAIHAPYVLEVSSPGLDRPLRAERDFARFAGKNARIRTRHPVGESRRNFKGKLIGAAEGKVRIEVDGQEYEIPVDDVEKANLEIEL
jgi:ribosome maturation factor RimP